MIRGRDFVVFSDDWGRHPSSSQHLFRRIAPHNRVLWVETIGLRRPRITRYDIERTVEKVRGWVRPGGPTNNAPSWAPEPEGLTRFSPPMHPFYGHPVGARINDEVLSRLIVRKAKAMGMHRPIVITTVPTVAGLVGRLEESSFIYYCVDDFETWPGYEATAIKALERHLIERCDALVGTAAKLIEDRARPGMPTLSLPHGVDVDMFAAGGEAPAPMAAVPHPRVMSLGLYDSRVDAAMLTAVAQAHPEWHFVFVGPRTAPENTLDALPNVHVMPGVPYNEVPRWLASADALIIPYVRNEQTDTINPLKLREFMATGRPVATTAMPEIVNAVGDLVPTGDGAEAFAKAIAEALQLAPESAALRRTRVEPDGWDARAEDLCDFLEEILD
ncbi:MAG: glycosyltransferase [Bradymonadia bacterium]